MEWEIEGWREKARAGKKGGRGREIEADRGVRPLTIYDFLEGIKIKESFVNFENGREKMCNNLCLPSINHTFRFFFY